MTTDSVMWQGALITLVYDAKTGRTTMYRNGVRVSSWR